MTKLQLIKYRNDTEQWRIDITKLTNARLLRLIMAIQERDLQIKRYSDPATSQLTNDLTKDILG